MTTAPVVTMVMSSQRQPPPADPLLQFLQRRLGLSPSALDLGLRQAELEQAPLPIVLWSFGLLSLNQLEEVFDWQNSQL
ncbi:hypothetical protein SynPROSU1_02221 [Synechococcus sp. PROS-U-1]|nr:hypothetical protein SynPROSU1_02221 [Synechococcus sp. PROS-U-1]